MYIPLLFLLYLPLSFTRNTKEYKEQWNITGNQNYRFFDSRTFGIDLPNKDPCTKVSRNSKFRDYINRNFQCDGIWCQYGKFKCDERGEKSCYHVEHIIDENGSEYRDCDSCKNIYGNMVMAYGQWNSELGGLASRYYMDAQEEKRIVYGTNIVDRVKNLITYCYNLEPKTSPVHDYDPECDTIEPCNCDSDSECGCDCDYDLETIPSDNSKYIHLIVAIGAVVLLVGIILLMAKYKCL
jgi:hypothetical protein